MSALTFFVTSTHCYAAIEMLNGIVKKSIALDGRTQASVLMPFLNDLWQSQGAPTVTALVVPKGPGSFTGLRVTLAVAVGFQMGFPAALCYAPTFFDILLGYAKKPSYAVIDSKRGDLFVCPQRDAPTADLKPLILSREAFQGFESEHGHMNRIVEPDLFLEFPDNTYDPMDLLDLLLDYPRLNDTSEFAPYYLFEPTFKKTNPNP